MWSQYNLGTLLSFHNKLKPPTCTEGIEIWITTVTEHTCIKSVIVVMIVQVLGYDNNIVCESVMTTRINKKILIVTRHNSAREPNRCWDYPCA